MALRGAECRFMYTGGNGATGVSGVADVPALSIGEYTGPSEPDEIEALSECYVDFQQGAVATSLGETNDFAVRPRPNYPSGAPTDSYPVAGDWIMAVDGANCGWVSRIVSNDGSTMVFQTPTPNLIESGAWLRVSKGANVFPDVTEEQCQEGLVDHRLLAFLKTNAGGENNFRFYARAVADNGCTIEIVPSSEADGGAFPTTGRRFPAIADAETTPFTPFGVVANRDLYDLQEWENSEVPGIYGVASQAVPDAGSDAVADESTIPVWIRRTIPPGTQPGECVFTLQAFVPDAVAQDATVDADPFIPGFVFSWSVLPISEQLTLGSDRNLYTRGSARIIGTAIDSTGRPLVGRYAFVEIIGGPGSIANPVPWTDAAGQVRAVYTAPVGGGPGQVVQFRLNVPSEGV